MIYHGLFKCHWGCVVVGDVDAFVRGRNIMDGYKTKCPNNKCSCTTVHLITLLDPTLVETNITVPSDSGDLKRIKDILVVNEYVFSDKDSSENWKIFEHPTGPKIVFNQTNYGRKTQKLKIFTQDNDPIIKQIIEVNKANKREKKANAIKKPLLPTSQQDFLGDTITIGDWVAFSSMSYTNLRVGKITKINQKSVTLLDKNGKRVTGKALTQIIKIPEQRALLLALES